MSNHMSTKPGKEPIANKKYESLYETSSTDRNRLALSPKQKAYLKANGIEARFIQKKQYLDANNFHRTGWKIIADPEMPGCNSEGLIEVGDLVLAVKSKEAQAVHRMDLKRKTDRYTDPKRITKQAAAELRESAKAASLNAQIHEGYEENGGKDSEDD